MTRLLFSIFVFFLLLNLPSAVLAGEFLCGFENDGTVLTSGLTKLANPRVRFVYVSFPEDPDSLSVSPTLNEDHAAVLDTLMSYFEAHSRGSFTFDSESDIILHPGESFTNSTATAWTAEMAASAYRDTNSLPEDYSYRFLSDWWQYEDEFASVLCAEILQKIYEEYSSVQSNLFDNTDFLVMVLLTHGTPFSDNSGGKARIAVNGNVLPNFFDGIERHYSGGLLGSCLTFLTEGQLIMTPRESAKGIAHEITHLLGAGDGPPGLGGYPWDEGRYYYGNQNLMCQVQIPGEGIPSIGLGWLQDLDWRGVDPDPLVVDFTGENLINLTIKDIRQDGGKIYKFRLDEAVMTEDAVSDQYFLFAYHAGTGIDIQSNSNGEPLMRSTGLEVWHCINNLMFDLESAFGLYSDPVEPIEVSSANGWSLKDVELGYDNHDWWELSGERPERDRFEYAEYVGEDNDFFRAKQAGPDSLLYNNFFTHESNPSTHWYLDDPGVSLLKRKPQQINNSLWVEIKQQQDAQGFMVLDLLTAPYEVVCVSPSGPYDVGDTLTISWEHRHQDFMTTVDVFFSDNAGLLYREIAVGLDPTQDFQWVIGLDDPTLHGKLKVVFNNNLSNHGGPFIYPDDRIEPLPMLEIAGPMYVTETLLSPEQGQHCFAHNETRIEWTCFFNDALHGGFGEAYGVEIDHVGLELFKDGDWVAIENNLVLYYPELTTPAYFYDSEKQVNFFPWYASNDFSVPDGRLRLTLFFDQGDSSGQSQRESDDEFLVYPVSVRFEDRTEDVLLHSDQQGYSGRPSGAIAFDVDGDSDLDLLVGMDIDQDGKSWLFKNDGGSFYKFPDVFPLMDAPSDGNMSLAQADFNNDGLPDLFLGHQTSPQLFENTGSLEFPQFSNVLGSLPTAVANLLEGTTCAAWVDWDHDSDLDLAVGRVAEGGTGGSKSAASDFIIINNGPLANWSFIPLGSRPSITNALTILDYDKDGYWDLFLGIESDRLFTYTETPHGTVELKTVEMPGSEWQSSIDDIQWTDHNNDGFFDLVLLVQNQKIIIYLNDQNGGFSQAITSYYEKTDRIEILDFNCDGWSDLLIGSSMSGSLTMLMNSQGLVGFPDILVDVSDAIGIPSSLGFTHAALAAPLSPGGHLDLFLGREEENGRFFQGVDPSNPFLEPSGHWVGIRLEAPNGSSRMGIGTILSIESADGLKQWRSIDGGSGSGNQNPTTVHFGLDGLTVPFEYSAYWPNGLVSNGTFSSAPDTTVVIAAPLLTAASIQIQDVSAFSILLPDERQNIHFQWKTSLRCDNGADKVVLVNPGSIPPECGMGSSPFGRNSPGVDYQMVRDSDGLYFHELVILGVPCSPGCNIEYQVQSGIGELIQSSDVLIFSTDTCGVSYTFPQP